MSGRIPSGTVVDRPIVRQWLFFAALCDSVIAYGSVYPVPQYISSIGLVTICSLSLSRPVSAFVRNIIHFALFLLFILVAISLYQIIPLHNSTQTHESWSLLSEHFPGTEGTVAAAPALTLFSLPQLITPFSVFISALLLFAGDTEAARFWRWLSIFGICIALMGIVQFELTPDKMLFAKKIYYKDVFNDKKINADFNNSVKKLLDGGIVDITLIGEGGVTADKKTQSSFILRNLKQSATKYGSQTEDEPIIEPSIDNSTDQ